MSKEDNSGPAFPLTFKVTRDCIGFDGEPCEPGTTVTYKGVSIRDYFAAKAMPACYADALRECLISGFPEDWKMGVALEAYAMADAMLEAREK